MLGIKAVRDSGENVRDEGYTIRISYEKSTASNYIVETNDAKMTITPVPLTIVFGNQERYYGEDNKNDYTLTVVGLKHGDTADVALKNNDGATAKVPRAGTARRSSTTRTNSIWAMSCLTRREVSTIRSATNGFR